MGGLARMKKETRKQTIPEGNIKTYLHWYALLKRIQEMPFKTADFDEPLKILRALQKKYDLSKEWLWAAYKPINFKLCEQINLSDPFRQVRHCMLYGQQYKRVAYKDLFPNTPGMKGSFKIRNYAKKREGPPVKNWAFNVLLSAIVEDMHWYGKGAKFAEAANIIENLDIKEINDKNLTYENVRALYMLIDQDDVMNLLKALCQGCREKGIKLVPPGVLIQDFPTDFLVRIADRTGYKENPYLSGKQRLSKDDIKSLPKHLKKLIEGEPRK
jgi:hypothetical protein